MKNKNAFTLIELLVVICIIAILCAMIIPAIDAVRRKQSHNNQNSYSNSQSQDNSPYSNNNVEKQNQINVGDLVYIDGLNITGKVNAIDFESPFADLLTKDTNGMISVLHHINTATLTKIQ